MLTRTAARTTIALVAALGLVDSTVTHAQTASSHAAHATVEPSDNWLKGLNASHKQFFDMSTPNGGVPLVHIMNYYDTYNKTYKVKDADIDAVLTFYGSTTLHGLNDAAWAKYRIGEFLETIDPATGKPAVRNPWRETPVVFGMTLTQASIETLAKRGATFILCNNALEIFATLIATKQGLNPTVVYNDLKANILPEVQLIPGMVIAVEQAAKAGLSYHKQ